MCLCSGEIPHVGAASGPDGDKGTSLSPGTEGEAHLRRRTLEGWEVMAKISPQLIMEQNLSRRD